MNSPVTVDVEGAIRYVRKNGGKIDQLRLDCFLGNRDETAAVDILSEYQYPSGGWFYEDDPKKVTSVGASSLWLRVLLELGLEETETVRRTADFLFEHQEADGSWYELREKLEESPQAWLSEDKMDNRLWFTVSTTVWLTEVGFGSHPCIVKSTRYLSDYWDEHESFRVTGYPYWAGLPFFAKTRGTESEAFRACYDYTLARLEEYNPFHLGWVLNMCKLAGMPAEDRLATAALDRLEGQQNLEGFWGSRYGGAYCTLFALNMLRNYGRIYQPES